VLRRCVRTTTCSLLNIIRHCFLRRVNSEVPEMLDADTFRALCQKVAEEKDPSKVEVLQERMRILLAARSERDRAQSSEGFVN
jgi:hypothetical protein